MALGLGTNRLSMRNQRTRKQSYIHRKKKRTQRKKGGSSLDHVFVSKSATSDAEKPTTLKELEEYYPEGIPLTLFRNVDLSNLPEKPQKPTYDDAIETLNGGR